MAIEPAEQISHAVGIVAAYVNRHHVPAADLPGFIASVHRAVAGLGQDTPATEAVERPTKRQIDASVKRDGIVSFIDGKTYKTLKRHLTKRGLTPAAYRTKFGLPSDYPMVCADYSAVRSQLAKDFGLGSQRRKLQAVA